MSKHAQLQEQGLIGQIKSRLGANHPKNNGRLRSQTRAARCEPLESRLLLSYDYNLSWLGPTHLARGQDLYVAVMLTTGASAPGEPIQLSFTPSAGLTPAFFGGHLNGQIGNFYNSSMQQLVQIAAATDAPLGETTITLTADSTLTHVIKTTTIDVIVDAMPSALPTPQFGAPQPIDPSVISDWESVMLSKGAEKGTVGAIGVPGPVESGTWYYDGTRVYNQIAEYTGDTSWYVQAGTCNDVYLPYVLSGGPDGQGWRQFAEGLVDQWNRDAPGSQERTDIETAIVRLMNHGPFLNTIYDVHGIRECSYALDNMVMGKQLGLASSNDYLMPVYADALLGYFDQCFITRNISSSVVYEIKPFMVGLGAEALINWYDYTVAQHALDSSFAIDTRVPVALKAAGDWLMGSTAQEAPRTDLAVNPTAATLYRSASTPFTAADVGSAIQITAGIGWTPGWYIIATAPDVLGYVKIVHDTASATPVTPSAAGNGNFGTGAAQKWNAWNPVSNCFIYDIVYNNGTVAATNEASIETTYSDALLNNLITPLFGWLYKMYGETEGSTYRVFGDAAFAAGVEISKNIWSGKEFSQNYRWSGDYVQWRLDNAWANDTTGPVLSQLTTSVLSTTGNYITWKTDEPASTIVEYGLTTAYGTTLTNDLVLTNHRQEITSLTPGLVYHYRITATDSSGNHTYYVGTFTAGLVGPTVVTPAGATPATVTGTSTELRVLGDDDGGEADLTYTWSVADKPAGAADPTYGASGTNAAKNTIATFSQAGSYTFQVTITDADGLSTTDTVGVTVNQTLLSFTVSPATATLNVNQTQQFTATGYDQFGAAMASQFVWSVTSGNGLIDDAGLYTASSAGGSATITATSGSLNSSAAITVTSLAGSTISHVVVVPAKGLITWNVQDSDGVQRTHLTVDGIAVSKIYGPYVAASGVDFSGIFGTLAAGSHNYVITATDMLGNSSQYSGTFTVAPNPGPAIRNVVVVPAKGLMTWNMQDSDGVARAHLTVDGGAVSSVYGPYAASLGVNYCAVLGPRSAGAHAYTITATDWLGNSSQYSDSFFVPPPTINRVVVAEAIPTNYICESNENLVITWAASSPNRIASQSLTVDGHAIALINGPYGGLYYLCPIGMWSAGSHAYSIRSTDSKGASFDSSGTFTVEAATLVSPRIASVVVAEATPTNYIREANEKLVITWAASSQNGISSQSITVDGHAIAPINGPYSGTYYSCPIGIWSAGSHAYSIRLTDSKGASFESSGTFTVEAATPALPRIASVVVAEATPTNYIREANEKLVITWAASSQNGISSQSMTVDGHAIALINGPYGGLYYSCPIGMWSAGSHVYSIRSTDSKGVSYNISDSFTVDAALMVEASAAPQGSAAVLSNAQLAPIVAAALRRLEMQLGSGVETAMAGVKIEMANLPAGMLGETSGNTIWIDDDGAGYGWFVDPTPYDDAEFLAATATNLIARSGSAAGNRADLLTTVMHEMGHLLGYQHSSELDLMHSTLLLGERRLSAGSNVGAGRPVFVVRAEVLDQDDGTESTGS